MRTKYFSRFRFVFLLPILVVAVACEGQFAGSKTKNIEVLNAPYRMRSVNVNAVPYVAIASTNFLADRQTGNLNFFRADDPRAPSKDASLSLELPSNVLDFYIEPDLISGRQRLYLLNRNESEISVYNFDGAVFSPVLEANGKAKKLETFVNPQSIDSFEFAGRDFLVISVQNSPTLQFLDLETETVLEEELLLQLFPSLSPEAYRSDRLGRVGARLSMIPRLNGGENLDRGIRGIAAGQSEGIGIGRVLVLPGSPNSTILGVSFLDTAIFGFRFDGFLNASNLLMNLRNAENGFTVDGQKFPGTRESGFRGASLDGQGHLFVSSRSDNSVYVMDTNLFEEGLETSENRSDRNTFALQENINRLDTRVQKLTLTNEAFDLDPTDEKFPRLGAIQVNSTGTKIWILGLADEERGFDQSTLYSITLADPNDPSNAVLTGRSDFAAGETPQQFLYFEAEDTLYVADVLANQIFLFDTSGTAADRIGIIDQDGNFTAD